AAAIAAIAWERVRHKLRGTQFTLRSADPAAARLLESYDALEALGKSIAQYDPLGSTLLQARAFRCALDAGEPNRILQALCFAAVSAAMSGAAGADRDVDDLLERASAL